MKFINKNFTGEVWYNSLINSWEIFDTPPNISEDEIKFAERVMKRYEYNINNDDFAIQIDVKPEQMVSFIINSRRQYNSFSAEEEEHTEEIKYDIENMLRMDAPNLNEPVFTNSDITNDYVLKYSGSIFEVEPTHEQIIQTYFKEILGFDEDKIINFKSPFVGCLINFAQYFNKQLKKK